MGLSIGCTGDIMSADGPGGTGSTPPSIDGMGNPIPPGTKPPEILPPPPPEMACESKEFTPARVWRLSDEQYANAVKDLIPDATVPTILTPGRSAQQFVDFAELFEIGPATVSDIRGSVSMVATEAVKSLDKLLGCSGADAACANRFVEGFASRAFRRPLEAAEKQGLLAVYAEGAKVTPAEGIRMVISAVLQAPSFLYRTELGKAATVAAGQKVELTPHELASSLSFLFLNSIPDAPLRAAADDGSLMNNDVFKSHVDRLIKMPRVQEHLTTVYLKWMGLGTGLNPDLATNNPVFTPALKASMEEEVRLFMKDMLATGTINDLLTTNKGFADRTLATHMGMPAPANGFASVTYPANQRSGVLTLPGIIGRYSVGHPEVFLGKFVRDEFLCHEIPPPGDLPAIEMEVEASKGLPVREQSARRLENSTCKACHNFMDPIGLTFLNYDPVGRFLTADKDGKPIDTSGEIVEAGDANGKVASALDLGKRLAGSKRARTCIESKMLSFALGRMTGDIDSCELSKIDQFTAQKGGKLSELMAAVVYSSAFRFRTGGN